MHYFAGDSMGDLVERNYRVLFIMSRFGMTLGFGDKSIGEVCASRGVDVGTFLALVNTAPDRDVDRALWHACGRFDVDTAVDDADFSPPVLLDYLSGIYAHCRDSSIPSIRAGLVEAWEGPENDLFKAVLRCYDDFAHDVHHHILYKEQTLFPWVRSLAEGVVPVSQSPDRQADLRPRFDELRRILIKYYPAGNTTRMCGVLLEIRDCELDIAFNTRVEERLLWPMINTLERNALQMRPVRQFEYETT